MSSLIHLPAGETLDYWWERLRDRPKRKRFMLTKILEVMSYQLAKNTSLPKLQPPNTGAILEMKPLIQLNGIHNDSACFVVVPARSLSTQNAEQISRLAILLLKQTKQVIFINDGSTHWPQLPSQVSVLTNQTSKGPASARNEGIHAALDQGAGLILLTDSDCVPCEDWVFQAKESFIANRYTHALSGQTRSIGKTWMDQYHDINGTLNGRRFSGTDILLYGPTCNLAITRGLALMIKFDEDFKGAACEDIDFCLRATQAGYRLLYHSAMVIRHDYRYRKGYPLHNFIYFVRQFQKYARAESTLINKCSAYYSYFAQTEEISSNSLI